MATTQNTFTGNGSNLGPFSFTFKWLESTDIKVSVGGVLKTAGTHYNLQSLNYTTKTGGQVLFTAGNAPANGASIRIFRDTDDDALSAVFSSGSAIRAKDLNDNFTQNLYVTQEINNNAVSIDGSNPMVSDFNMNGYKITNLAAPVAGTDAANRSFVEGVFSSKVPVFYRRWSKTAVGGETGLSGNDDNGIALSYVPGSEKVFINGALQVRGIDYSGTTGSTLSGIPALTAGDIIEVHSSSSYTVGTVPDGSVTNAKVDGGAAIQSTKLAFIQNGTGAVTRTVDSKLKDVISVKDFGAVGDGVADDTAAIQAAINYVQAAAGLPAPADGTFALHFPPGNYKTGTLTVTGPIALVGDGRQATYLTLNAGVTTPLLVFNAVNIGSTSLDDFTHAKVSGMTLMGNRTDTVTTNGSHGIHCPDPGYPMATQYAASVSCSDMEIINFSGSGIVTGPNRNLLWLDHVIVRYCNKNGVIISGVDNKISNCEFGVTGDAAAKLEAGGTTGWSNCYFYFCVGPCVFASQFAVGPNWFVNCVFDTPKSHCVTLNGPADPSPYSFVNCRFAAPGRDQAGNIYSHIVATNLKALNVHNCFFAPYSPYANKAKYLLDATNVGYVSWIGNTWDTSDLPYQTGILSSGITSIIRSDVGNQTGFGTGSIVGTARVGIDGDVGLQAASKTTARYIGRTDAGSTNPLARIGMVGAGTNGFQGKFTVEVKKSDTFNGALSELLAITPAGNLLIGGPTEANCANGIQIKEGGSIFGNPANSGFLFVDAGALKYKGSSGTITTIANA